MESQKKPELKVMRESVRENIKRKYINHLPGYDEAIDRAANGMCVECGHYAHEAWTTCSEFIEGDCYCQAILMYYISLDDLREIKEEKAMKEKEYRPAFAYFQVPADPEKFLHYVNVKALEGWEFVTNMPASLNVYGLYYTGLFKRTGKE